MTGPAPWSREWIEARAERLSSTAPPEPSAPTPWKPSAYERAAAVLAWFDPDVLRPDAPSPGDRSDDDGGSQLQRLLRDSVPIEGDGEPDADAGADAGECRHLSLRNDLRVRVLAHLSTPGVLRSALAANPDRPRNSLQAIFEAYVEGNPRALETLSLDELSATLQVIDWLQATELAPALPLADGVRRRLRYQELLQPFRALVGTHFRGRKTQLDVLQEYVGVLEPTSLRDGVTRVIRTVLGRHRRAPLLVWGPGGIGKSTLIAKFILDHAAAGPAALPFVYLDCDRPGLVAEEPLTMLIESVRQIAVQFPEHADRCRSLQDSWQAFIAAGASSESNAAAPNRDRRTFVADFARLVDDVGIRDTPYLLVVDTFEAVQYRSQDLVAELWRFIGEVQQVLPRLRVVVAGRARPSGISFEELYLDRLDAESAQGFLQARVKLPDQIARAIAGQLRGNPLSLKLAAQVLRDEDMSAGPTGLRGLDVTSGWGRKIDDNLIQGQLYHRILRHIRDREPTVSKLAHPGLVLRRVTPELIQQVLAKPCGVKVETLADAEELFARFKRQVSLVNQAGPREVRHRPDVRRAMLPLIRKESGAKSREIDEAAVAFYAQEPGPANRAEEIYHRLALDQPQHEIDSRFIPGVEDYLQGEAIDEIPERLRPYLASRVGIDLVELDWETVDTGTWERYVEHRAQHLLQVDQPEQALALIRRRGDADPQGRLPIWEARSLERLGRLREAVAVARPAIARLERDQSDDPALLDLCLLVARAQEWLGEKPPPAERQATLHRLQAGFGGDPRLGELSLLYGPPASTPPAASAPMRGAPAMSTAAPAPAASAPRGLLGVGVAYHGTTDELLMISHVALEVLRTGTDLAAFAKRFLQVPLESISAPQTGIAETISDVIRWADSQGRVPEIVSGLLELSPGNPDLAAFDRRGKRQDGEASLGQVPLGRRMLVEWMTELEHSPGGEVLIVDGPRGSGKSFSSVLLANHARASGAFDCISLKLRKFARRTPRDLVEEMARIADWGSRSMPSDGASLLLWVASLASRGRLSVLLFDECRAVEKTMVGDFVLELARLVLMRKPRGLSVMLVDFPPEVLPDARCERLGPVTLRELSQVIEAQLAAAVSERDPAIAAHERAAVRGILADESLRDDKARLAEAVEQLRKMVRAIE